MLKFGCFRPHGSETCTKPHLTLVKGLGTVFQKPLNVNLAIACFIPGSNSYVKHAIHHRRAKTNQTRIKSSLASSNISVKVDLNLGLSLSCF